MFKTYRFIPCVFILFLFGLTLITVSPVFAEDSPGFIACKQIKPRGNFKLMKQKKNCFRDVARLFQGQSGPAQPVAPIDPSGGEVAQLNNRIAELEAAVDKAKLEIQERVAEKVELQEAVRKAEGNASLSTLREDNLRHGISTIGCKREIDAACSGVIKGKLYRSINRLCLNITDP
jgi:hypothetical protein